MLTPIRCFNHALLFLTISMLEMVFSTSLKTSSPQQNVTTANIYDCLFAQMEHHNQLHI